MILCFSFVYFSRSITYYRLDTRGPDRLQPEDGFKPRGDDMNVLNHCLDRHPPGTFSGYISFTTDWKTIIQQFWKVGYREMWLYEIEVQGKGLPSVHAALRKTFEHVVNAMMLLDENFPSIPDIETAKEHVNRIVFQYMMVQPNEGMVNLVGELNSVILAYDLSDEQKDHVSQHIPYSAIQKASRICLREDGTYFTVEEATFPQVKPAKAETLPRRATDASVFVTPLSAAEMDSLRELPGITKCGRGCCILQAENGSDACPDYMYQVITPPNYDASITFLQQETSVSGIDFGQWLPKWSPTNKGKQNIHCALNYDAENAENAENGVKCQIIGEGENISEMTRVHGSFGNMGWSDGGQAWVDVNGDENTDYCRLVNYPPRIRCDLSNGTAFDKQIESSAIDEGYGYERWWADVNGDGADDFCCLTSDGMKCTLGGKEPFKQVSDFWDDDWGWDDSRAWADIEGLRKSAFCRILYGTPHIRCNSPQSDGSWKRFESGPENGGWPGYRWWVRLYGPSVSYCRVTGGRHENMICTSIINGEFKSPETFALPASPGGTGDVTFVDLGGRGLLDVCVLDSNRILKCKLNLGDGRWSSTFSPPFQYNKGFGNFANGQQVIFPRAGNHSQYCRNVGGSTLRCMKIDFQSEAVLIDVEGDKSAYDVCQMPITKTASLILSQL